jgi:hypothetical protein
VTGDVGTNHNLRNQNNLRNLNGTNSLVAVAAGFWSPNDGGGGTFYWDGTSSSGDNGGTIVVPSNQSPAPGRWIRVFQGCFDAAWFGATGTTDDTTYIQNAINALPNVVGGNNLTRVGPGCVLIPAGTHPVTRSLTLARAHDVEIRGVSRAATIVSPSAALQGSPVLLLTDTRNSLFRDLTIQGNQGAPPSAAIESHVDDNASGAQIDLYPTSNTFRNLSLGTESAGASTDSAIVDGLRFTAASDNDGSNGLSTIDNVNIGAFTGAAVSIEHNNSLGHRITGGVWASGASSSIGVQTMGGSFDLWGSFVQVGLVDFYLHAPANDSIYGASTKAYYHSIQINNVVAESTADLLYTDAAWTNGTGTSALQGVDVMISGYDKKGDGRTIQCTGPAPLCPTAINFQSAGTLTIFNSRLYLGVPTQFTFLGDQLNLHGNRFESVRFVEWSKYLSSSGNHWSSTPVQTVSTGGILNKVGDHFDVTGTGYWNDSATIGSAYVPTSSSDTNGNIGDVEYDNSYMYMKTASGWKRTSWSTF